MLRSGSSKVSSATVAQVCPGTGSVTLTATRSGNTAMWSGNLRARRPRMHVGRVQVARLRPVLGVPLVCLGGAISSPRQLARVPRSIPEPWPRRRTGRTNPSRRSLCRWPRTSLFGPLNSSGLLCMSRNSPRASIRRPRRRICLASLNRSRVRLYFAPGMVLGGRADAQDSLSEDAIGNEPGLDLPSRSDGELGATASCSFLSRRSPTSRPSESQT
jgi:hypothetical protein